MLNTNKYNEDLANGTLDKEYEIITSIYANGFTPIHDVERLPKSFRCYPDRDHYNSHPFLKGEDEPIVKPEETLNVSKIIELFYKSAEENREVFAD